MKVDARRLESLLVAMSMPTEGGDIPVDDLNLLRRVGTRTLSTYKLDVYKITGRAVPPDDALPMVLNDEQWTTLRSLDEDKAKKFVLSLLEDGDK